MAYRRGMDKGRGKGYRNVINKDSSVHSMSAKGIKQPQKTKELLVGGYGDYKPDSEFDRKQLRQGIKVEYEHTNDYRVAKEIAKDHLTEHPEYYKALKKMENKLQGKNVHPTKKDLAYHKWEHKLMDEENFKDTDGDKAPDIIDCEPFNPDEQGIKDSWQSLRKNLSSYFKAYKDTEEYKNLPEKEKRKLNKFENDIGYINSKYTLDHFVNKHNDVIYGASLLVMASTIFPAIGQAVLGAVEGIAVEKEVFKDVDEWDKAKEKWVKKLKKQLPDVGDKEIKRLAGKEAIKEIYSGFDLPKTSLDEVPEPQPAVSKNNVVSGG